MGSRKILISLSVLTVLLSISPGDAADESNKRIDSHIPGSCTIFFISHGESAFFGNNEDWKNPLTYYWVEPPTEDTYGVFCLGYDNLYPQGGINEKGLAFDANALPRIPVKKNEEGIKPFQAIVNTIIMQRCATVSEAIEMAKSYDWSQCYGGSLDGQFLLADPSGDAVVIGADPGGELVFTRKKEGDGFIVSTNFNRAFPDNRYGRYPCRRYETTARMLAEIEDEDDLTIDRLASILEEVHQEGRKINTLYSNIFDMKNGVVYLYYWHDFEHAARLDVAELIASQPPPARIETLFPVEFKDQADAEFGNYKRRPVIIFAGMALLGLGLVSLSIIKRGRQT